MAFISLQEHKILMPMKLIRNLHYPVDLVPNCPALCFQWWLTMALAIHRPHAHVSCTRGQAQARGPQAGPKIRPVCNLSSSAHQGECPGKACAHVHTHTLSCALDNRFRNNPASSANVTLFLSALPFIRNKPDKKLPE